MAAPAGESGEEVDDTEGAEEPEGPEDPGSGMAGGVRRLARPSNSASVTFTQTLRAKLNIDHKPILTVRRINFNRIKK